MGLKEKLVAISTNNPLLKIQVFYFFYEGATKSLSRYLGLYYKHTLLLSPHQVALLLFARSFALLFGSPVLGSIADKLKGFRKILILCLFAYIATYFIVPFVEPIDGFNCRDHLNNSNQFKLKALKEESLSRKNRHFSVKIHKYSSEIRKTYPVGQHYHGNLMYDLFYTWPLDVWEYLATDSITKKLFISLLIITIIGEFLAAPSETIADVYTLQTLGSDQKKYGLIIIPGLLGWVIITLLFAVITNSNVELKDDFCHVGHITNYSPYLFVFYAMIFVCIIIAFMLKFTHSNQDDITFKEKCSCNVFRAMPILFKTPAHVSFCIVIIFCGFGSGVKQLYVYHYITDLGGSITLLPIIVGVHFLSAVLALIISPYLLQKFGNIKILNASLFMYGVTFVVYSVIENPLLMFLVEPFDGITNQLCWVAIVTYVGSPPKVGAALQGLIHGLYRGLGISLGYLAVSMIILKYGYFMFFLCLGLTFFCVLFLFLAVGHYFPQQESIAESLGYYHLLFPGNNNDDYDEEYNDEENAKRGKFERNYENTVLDSSFLD